MEWVRCPKWTYIYIYIYVCVCVCVCSAINSTIHTVNSTLRGYWRPKGSLSRREIWISQHLVYSKSCVLRVVFDLLSIHEIWISQHLACSKNCVLWIALVLINLGFPETRFSNFLNSHPFVYFCLWVLNSSIFTLCSSCLSCITFLLVRPRGKESTKVLTDYCNLGNFLLYKICVIYWEHLICENVSFLNLFTLFTMVYAPAL